MDGLVVVDKPAGWTSHDVVARLRRVYGQRRVGHGGTLDPDATGVLLVGLGRVTRLLRYLQGAGKAYRARFVLGVATDTLDASGTVLERRSMTVTREDVERAAAGLVGEIEQVPPMVSAVKIGGRRLHELAREGKEVARPPRRVRVDRLEVEELEPGPHPEVTVHVECSAGTYVRTLAADLGAALGGCGHVAWLRRLRVGSFTLDEAHPLEEVERDPEGCVLPPLEAVRDLERLVVDARQAGEVSHGAALPTSGSTAGQAGPGAVAVVGPAGELLAVYERRGAALRASVVLVG